jgi:hypothetical protein
MTIDIYGIIDLSVINRNLKQKILLSVIFIRSEDRRRDSFIFIQFQIERRNKPCLITYAVGNAIIWQRRKWKSVLIRKEKPFSLLLAGENTGVVERKGDSEQRRTFLTQQSSILSREIREKQHLTSTRYRSEQLD